MKFKISYSDLPGISWWKQEKPIRTSILSINGHLITHSAIWDDALPHFLGRYCSWSAINVWLIYFKSRLWSMFSRVVFIIDFFAVRLWSRVQPVWLTKRKFKIRQTKQFKSINIPMVFGGFGGYGCVSQMSRGVEKRVVMGEKLKESFNLA